MKKVLIFYGGWEGHEPVEVANCFKNMLEQDGYKVVMSDTLECLNDLVQLKTYSLIIPVWTMGEIDDVYVENISEAVASGVGLAGCHGGMCDAFRNNVLWQFMTGGNWVAHPGNDGVTYTVNIGNTSSELVRGIDDFEVTSEQYYLHVDPVVDVLATTRFPVAEGYHVANGVVDMPVIWTKMWGKGKIYYNSLGHNEEIVRNDVVYELMRRGFIWATKEGEC